MENIFGGTPYESYEDLVKAIAEGKAKFSYWRAGAYNIASSINTISFFTYYLGFILSIVILVTFSIYTNNYWTLLFIPILFFLYLFIHKLNSFIVLICIIVIIILMYFHIQLWILSLLVSIVALFIGYHIWWGITTSIVNNELTKNEQLFITIWKSKTIAIRDNLGNFYMCRM